MQTANFPNLDVRQSYLVFVPGVETSPVFFDDQWAAVKFAAGVSGFVVEASHVMRMAPQGATVEEEKVHELRFED